MHLLFTVIGLFSGFVIASGVFTTLIAVGLLPRFAEKTNTSKYIKLYENMIILGTILGNIFTVYKLYTPFKSPLIFELFLCIYGLFSGIFVGCLAITIAEMLNAIPIFTRRIALPKTNLIILAISIGKTIGSLIYFLLLHS